MHLSTKYVRSWKELNYIVDMLIDIQVGEVLKDTLPESLPPLSHQGNEVDEAKEKEVRNNSNVASNALPMSSIAAAQFGDNVFLSPDRQRRRCSRQRSRQRSVRREVDLSIFNLLFC